MAASRYDIAGQIPIPGTREADLVEFETLLDEADQDVYAWIIGQEPVPAERDTPLMQRLRAFRPSAA